MKISLLFFFSLYYICAEAQFRFGLQGGYNSAQIYPRNLSSNIYTDQSSLTIYNYSTSRFRGFTAGVVAEVTLAHNWFLRPGVLVNQKGTRLKRIGFGDTSTRFIELHYIEVPVTLVHRWKADEKLSILGGGGVYAARAFRGVEKGEGTTPGGPYYLHNYVNFSSRNEENKSFPTIINPTDYGITMVAGLERQGIQLIVSYNHGLRRVFPKSNVFQEKSTNRVLGISAVYLFTKQRE